MPIISSSILNQITDKNYTESIVPYFPENKWKHGYMNFYLIDFEIFLHGILRGWNSDYLSFDSSEVDSTYGPYVRHETAASSGSSKYHEIPRYNSWLIDIPTKILFRFRLNQSTNLRWYFGFWYGNSGDVSINQDDLLADTEGFGLRVGNNLNFKIHSNNGSANSNISSDIATIDTNPHQIYLEFDPDNSRCGYSFDSAAVTWVTSQIPTSMTYMRLGWAIITQENAAKSWDLFNIEAMQKEMK